MCVCVCAPSLIRDFCNCSDSLCLSLSLCVFLSDLSLCDKSGRRSFIYYCIPAKHLG